MVRAIRVEQEAACVSAKALAESSGGGGEHFQEKQKKSVQSQSGASNLGSAEVILIHM